MEQYVFLNFRMALIYFNQKILYFRNFKILLNRCNLIVFANIHNLARKTAVLKDTPGR